MVLTAENDLNLNVLYAREEYGGVFVLWLMIYLNRIMIMELNIWKVVDLPHSILTQEIFF